MIIEQFQHLNERFHIRHCFFIPSYLDDDCFRPDIHFLLVDGSLYLDKDLMLDWGKLEVLAENDRHKIYGLIVLGDLVIDGDMLNTNSDGGPLLLVRGNLVAHNLLAGGADIIVGRDTNIRDVVFSNYNHGGLHVTNNLYTSLLVMRDHCFNAHAVHALHTVDDDADMEPDSEEYPENLRRINEYLDTPIEELEDLEALLEKGLPVLKVSARNTRVLKPAWFPETREDVIKYVQTHDNVYSGAIPFLLCQDRAFMLSLTRMHPDIYKGLKNRWHLAPDFMHAALDAGNKEVFNYIRFVKDPQEQQRLQSRIFGLS